MVVQELLFSKVESIIMKMTSSGKRGKHGSGTLIIRGTNSFDNIIFKRVKNIYAVKQQISEMVESAAEVKVV